METIIDALKAMGKASSIEIAARLDMDRQEVIGQLWELKDAGVVQQDGQGWTLADGFTPERDEKIEIKPVGMKADDLINIITEKGPITLEELAAAASVTTRRVASTLAMPTSRGRVVRQKLGEKFHYMLPGSETAPEQAAASKVAMPATDIEIVNTSAPKPEITVPAMASKTVVERQSNADFLNSIPSLTEGKSAMLQVPTLTIIAREIRKTKTKLARLGKLRAAVRELNRHKTMMDNLSTQLISPPNCGKEIS